MTILGEVRTRIGQWCDEHMPAEYPLSREQAITLVSLAIAELHDSELNDLAKARIAELEAKLDKVDVCEVCKDVLTPQSPRCEKHAHTEPGDDDWPEEEP